MNTLLRCEGNKDLKVKLVRPVRKESKESKVLRVYMVPPAARALASSQQSPIPMVSSLSFTRMEAVIRLLASRGPKAKLVRPVHKGNKDLKARWGLQANQDPMALLLMICGCLKGIRVRWPISWPLYEGKKVLKVNRGLRERLAPRENRGLKVKQVPKVPQVSLAKRGFPRETEWKWERRLFGMERLGWQVARPLRVAWIQRHAITTRQRR